MPTYEYKCTKCRHLFEAFQKMSDSPIESCPKCKGKVDRIISGGTGLIFKGSGFYITDYKKKGEKKESGVGESKKDSKAKPDSVPKSSPDSSASKNKSSD